MNGEKKVRVADLESDVSSMQDVGVVIRLVDDYISKGEMEEAQRAAIVLQEVFDSRFEKLRSCIYGGGTDDE